MPAVPEIATSAEAGLTDSRQGDTWQQVAGQTLGQLFIQGGQAAEAAPQHHHLGVYHRDGGGEPGGQDLQPAVDGRERRGFPGLGAGNYQMTTGALAAEVVGDAGFDLEVWNELTRRLPDGTYLEKLAIENNSLQLIGLSSEASQLVPLLQDAPQWRKVNLTGVLQADGAASGRDRFTLTAELQPLPGATPAAPAAAPVAEGADGNADHTP
mgnify:CR=1 FL=1